MHAYIKFYPLIGCRLALLLLITLTTITSGLNRSSSRVPCLMTELTPTEWEANYNCELYVNYRVKFKKDDMTRICNPTDSHTDTSASH